MTQQSQIEACELWQGHNEAYTAVVLECIFNYLSARDLWRCGSVCRAWRHTATNSALWRHLMLPHATPDILRTITETHSDDETEWSWRKEYALQTARWERCGRLNARSAGSAPLQCAALHDSGALLALVDEDAYITIWEQTSVQQWSPRWSGACSAAWRGAALAQWAPAAARLLLAGRLALVDRYEMLVMHFDEVWCSRVTCRSASGPGSAGCWVNDDAYLSLRLRLLAPGRACTTLWLNAASLEVYSEYAGVTTPLLRIYNEASAHISHILVAEVSKKEVEKLGQQENKNDDCDFPVEPGVSYYRSNRPQKPTKENNNRTQRVLIAAGGVAGGARGESPVCVDDELAQRVQRHRERARADPAPDAQDVPDEDAVRALCSPPAATLCLRSQILGIVLHPRGGCVWATTEVGATCASLPALTPLLHIPRAVGDESGLSPHLLQPCVDDNYFVTPAGAGSGSVCVWTARAGRSASRLPHGAPALAAFLPASACAPRRLLVLATDGLHILRSLTCDKTGRARRGSCTPVPEAACAPCEAAPRPACHAPQPSSRAGERRVCCAPPPRRRPPCDAPAPPRPWTCEHNSLIQNTENRPSVEYNAQQVCGAQLNKVAMRLKAAEHARRLDYEKEVGLQLPPQASISKPYKLSGMHECLRATDGRDYALTSKTTGSTRCSSDRSPPPPCPLSLKSDDNCQIHRGHHFDPCAHHPRVFLEIDRSASYSADTTLASKESTKDCIGAEESVKQTSSTSRCPRQSCNSQSTDKSEESNSKSWCKGLPPPDVPTPCKELSFIERLRLRPGGMSNKNDTPRREMHTSSRWSAKASSLNNTNIGKEEKQALQKLTSALVDRTEFKEAGKGRIVTAQNSEKSNKNFGAGGLEMKVPANADAVRVRVSLDFDNTAPENCRVSNPSDQVHSHTYSSCKTDGGSDSWLSIKNLQKKLSGYRKSETSTDIKKTQDFGTCKRPNTDKEAISEKKSTCSSPSNKTNISDKPPSPCSQGPCQQSPCAPRGPKTTTPRCSSLQDIFDIGLGATGKPCPIIV